MYEYYKQTNTLLSYSNIRRYFNNVTIYKNKTINTIKKVSVYVLKLKVNKVYNNAMNDWASEVCRSNRWGVYRTIKCQIDVIIEISLTC